MLSIGSLMMIMPLGPDFVRELDMPADRIGYLAGAATLAAALGSALSAAWLDRFERKPVLLALLVLLLSPTVYSLQQSQRRAHELLPGAIGHCHDSARRNRRT